MQVQYPAFARQTKTIMAQQDLLSHLPGTVQAIHCPWQHVRQRIEIEDKVKQHQNLHPKTKSLTYLVLSKR